MHSSMLSVWHRFECVEETLVCSGSTQFDSTRPFIRSFICLFVSHIICLILAIVEHKHTYEKKEYLGDILFNGVAKVFTVK